MIEMTVAYWIAEVLEKELYKFETIEEFEDWLIHCLERPFLETEEER